VAATRSQPPRAPSGEGRAQPGAGLQARPEAGEGAQRNLQQRAENPEARRQQRQANAEERSTRSGERQRDASREERSQNVDDLRQERQENRGQARDGRSEAMGDLQENRQDFLEAQQEDRQDFADDLWEEREDLYRDIYDDRHYWGGYDDDDDEWLWGLVGGVAGFALGVAVSSPPEAAVPVPVQGSSTTYQYYGGAFYEPAPTGEGYVTAPAPVGATVDAPPLNCTIVFGPPPDELGYCYFQGAFFLYNQELDQYVVAEPPTGVAVPYLPEGYTEENVEGVTYFKLGGYYYRPYFEGDEMVYVVSAV